MADTKKEHYVPRCYLKNFAMDNSMIWVFDKYKTQRRKQKIMEIAMENYFYDIDCSSMISKAEKDEKIKAELKEQSGLEEWEDIVDLLNNKKYVEKDFFSNIESFYELLLEKLIDNSHGGNQWVIDNCFAFLEIIKDIFSFFVAIQMLRTKSFRSGISDAIEQFYNVLPKKFPIKGLEPLRSGEFHIKANDEYVKLQHTLIMLDEKELERTAEILNNHIWVMYVNKTDMPFYTSDNPVITIPHKSDKYMSYGGIASEGVEIVFPITPNLLLAMYEKTWHSNRFSDRSFVSLTSKEKVAYFNMYQIMQSDRCVFSIKDDFGLAEQMCEEFPQLKEYQPKVKVT